MSQPDSPDSKVEVLFRNGDSITVDAVARLVGADWITAMEWVPDDDYDDDTQKSKNYILCTDDIRGIVSDDVKPIGNKGLNARLHTSGGDYEMLSDLWKGQHQLHPDNDPSAFEGSEERWPPSGFENTETLRP